MSTDGLCPYSYDEFVTFHHDVARLVQKNGERTDARLCDPHEADRHEILRLVRDASPSTQMQQFLINLHKWRDVEFIDVLAEQGTPKYDSFSGELLKESYVLANIANGNMYRLSYTTGIFVRSYYCIMTVAERLFDTWQGLLLHETKDHKTKTLALNEHLRDSILRQDYALFESCIDRIYPVADI